ncbi:MAG: LytR family transcriptional regulator [Veillonella sp.]|nr:LytR family transcriptional regulator [Veillonella sp.]
MDERERARARRRRKRRQQKPSVKWPRVILAIVVVFTLLGGIGYGIYSGVSYAYRAIVGTTEATEAVTDSGNKQDANTVSVEQKGLDKPLYILVIGTDDNNPSQGDSLFLLSVNLDQKTMDVIGIPSNSKIDNRDQTDATMLNSIYEKGGIELTKAVIDYVEQPMEHIDAEGNIDIDLRRGYQTLDSNNALAYLRYSDPKHDTFTRVQRQERFLKLWVEQEHNAFFLTNAWHIWRIWDHYDSNISTLDAIKLVYNASKINKEEIHFYILPGEKELIGETTYWKVNPTEAQRLVGITMGNLPANEMTQFISAPTNSTSKVAPESEHNGGTITKPTEPGEESGSKR